MNRKAIIIATTLALAGLTACNPVPQVVTNIVTPAPAVRPTPTTTTIPFQGSCPWVNEGTYPNEYPVQHCELLGSPLVN